MPINRRSSIDTHFRSTSEYTVILQEMFRKKCFTSSRYVSHVEGQQGECFGVDATNCRVCTGPVVNFGFMEAKEERYLGCRRLEEIIESGTSIEGGSLIERHPSAIEAAPCTSKRNRTSRANTRSKPAMSVIRGPPLQRRNGLAGACRQQPTQTSTIRLIADDSGGLLYPATSLR